MASNRRSAASAQALAAREIAAQRRQRKLARLYGYGERVTSEFLVAFADAQGVTPALDTALDDWLGRLDRIGRPALAALGADRLPPPPIHQIQIHQGGKPDDERA